MAEREYWLIGYGVQVGHGEEWALRNQIIDESPAAWLVRMNLEAPLYAVTMALRITAETYAEFEPKV